MESMKEIKEWLLNKCRIPNISIPVGNHSSAGKEDVPSFGSVVTPQNIPEFVIPGSNDSSRHPSIGTCSNEDDLLSHSSETSLPCSAHTSPGISPRSSFSCLSVPARRSPIHTRSAPVSPRHEAREFTSDFGARSFSNIICVGGDTNADPQSVAAMSLPHFKTRTSYGFTTLTESPHTRRKESLFHANEQAVMNYPAVCNWKCTSSYEGSNNFVGNVLQDMGQDTSPRGSPQFRISHDRPSTVLFACSDEDNLPRRENCRRSPRYYRRRSSLPGLQESLGDSFDETSSTENSPGIRRRGRQRSLRLERPKMKRHSSPNFSPTSPTPQYEDDIHQRSSSAYNLTVPTVFLNPKPPFGELKFSFHYKPDTRQLRVLLIKAENLGGQIRADGNINAFAKLYLMPGKIQKQTSEVIKHNRNPVFNETFYFNDISFEALQTMCLRIRLFHKGHLRPTEFLGDVNMVLEKYDLFQENRMWKDLDPKTEKEDLGHLHLSLMFDQRDELLTLTVAKAKSLPQHHITGAPDPYIRIDLMQTGKGILRKQTRTRKKTTNPIFMESFKFKISAKPEDMQQTAILLTVFDHDRIRTDDVIGQVRVGVGATEDSEIEHWNEAMKSPGCEIQKWHYIMEKLDDNL